MHFETGAYDRVVTNGRYKPLEVFHTGDAKGFGVWSPEKIREGDFICEYIGEILVRGTTPATTNLCWQFQDEHR